MKACSENKYILVFAQRESKRLQYMAHVLGTYFLGIPFRVCHKEDEFYTYPGPKICYHTQVIGNSVFIQAHSLLFESGIKYQELHISIHKDLPIIFPSTHKEASLPFDVFAACFYFLTRYEEYLPHKADQHNRYEPTESIAYKNGFLHIPVVNHWVEMLKNSLLQTFPSLHFPEKKFRFISTIDIDNAYAYKEKGFVRNSAALARDILKLKFHQVWQRLKVLSGVEKDPYDTYDSFQFLHNSFGIRPLYFFLLADYGPKDKNVWHGSAAFQHLIKSLADVADVGIHPSYKSNTQPELIGKEIQRLASYTKQEITRSRQHFLVLHFPETYKRIMQHGIKADYSLGFPSVCGFRAGTCSPYPFYNLDSEQACDLLIYPISVMDATLHYYNKQTPEEAKQTITAIMQEVKKVNGTFISVWHNESLSEQNEWKGWKNVYEHVLLQAQSYL